MMQTTVRLGTIILLIHLACFPHRLCAEMPASPDAFAGTVGPFLARHCTKCHGSELAENDVRLDRLDPARSANADRRLWLTVLDRISLGTMPPEDEPRPPREELEKHSIGHALYNADDRTGWELSEKIGAFHFQLIARFMKKLQSIAEGDGLVVCINAETGTRDG